MVGENVQVGDDPFSQQITGTLADLMQGDSSPFGTATQDALMQLLGSGGGATTQFGQNTEGTLMDLLANSGKLDQDVINQRMETAEEGINRIESQRMSQLDSRLADRGLLGSGYETGGIEGVGRDITDLTAGAFRDIMSNEQEAANQRFINAAGLATGYAGQQPRNLIDAANAGTNRQNLFGRLGLDAATAGTQRQDILSRIALDTLKEQNDFAQFLAQFGLDRETTLRQLENNELGQIMAALQSLFQTPQIGQRGYL
jgi:hypothetical protein